MPVDIWFIVIPESIYQFGRPNSKIPKSAENINIGLKKQERNSTQLDMFFQHYSLAVSLEIFIIKNRNRRGEPEI